MLTFVFIDKYFKQLYHTVEKKFSAMNCCDAYTYMCFTAAHKFGVT